MLLVINQQFEKWSLITDKKFDNSQTLWLVCPAISIFDYNLNKKQQSIFLTHNREARHLLIKRGVHDKLISFHKWQTWKINENAIQN